MEMPCERDLFELIRAASAPGGLTSRLNSRQQKRHKDPDDRDYDQQLDECKRSTLRLHPPFPYEDVGTGLYSSPNWRPNMPAAIRRRHVR
jgi:hypothetical protein